MFLYLNIHWEKYDSTLPWLRPGAIPKWYQGDGIKLVGILIEQLCEIYVRRFHIDFGANYQTEKYEHLFIILKKQRIICDIAIGE